MSQIESTKRHFLIIKKLRQAKRATFAEIADYLNRETELDGYYDFNISKRTFARDLEDIGTAFGIYIKYDFSGKFYFIEEDFEPEVSDRMFEAFGVYNALNVNIIPKIAPLNLWQSKNLSTAGIFLPKTLTIPVSNVMP
jgi:predicted DNA-binding transcriptional regulator YafY